MAETQTYSARFLSKVSLSKSDKCWPWKANRHRKGYGLFKLGGKTCKAHRIAWQLANDPIPEGMKVLHRCDNPPCCNPAHLFLGTDLDNARDRDAKGRRAPPRGELNGEAKLRWAQVAKIRALYSARKGSQSALAGKYGVTQGHISRIVRGVSWGP